MRDPAVPFRVSKCKQSGQMDITDRGGCMFTPAVIRQKLHRQMVPGWPLSAVGSADGNLTITAISRFSTDVMNLQREAAPPPPSGFQKVPD